MPYYRLRQSHTLDGKVRVWQGWSEDGKVFVRHGIEGGKMQETVDVPGSVGVEGTKSFVGPVEQADLVVTRMARSKKEKGYVEEGEQSPDRVDFDLPELPKNVCFPKPVKKLPVDKLKKTYGSITSTDFCFTRKRDGMMSILARTRGEVKLYSRRMDDISARCPNIIEEASTWMPEKSILVGECIPPTEEDDFKYVCKVLRSLPEKAIRRQDESGHLKFYIFGIIYWAGELVMVQDTMEEILCRIGRIPESEHIEQVQLIGCDTLRKLNNTIVEEDWEGAVIYLRDGKMQERDLSFAGKERRPPVYWKYKIAKEDDFVILGWEEGTGKNMDRLGAIQVGKMGPDGSLVSYGWCGTGFTDALRGELASDDVVGRVVQVEFDKLTSDRQLRFPKFIRFRPDKTPEECTE